MFYHLIIWSQNILVLDAHLVAALIRLSASLISSHIFDLMMIL